MFEDNFTDSMKGDVVAEVIEDGEFVIVNVTDDEGYAVGIALTAEQAKQMAFALNTLAAGL